jgi:thiol-disulfide isomerase/thioredoxin
MYRIFSVFLVVLTLSTSTMAELPGGDSRWFELSKPGSRAVTLYFFWSDRCPHCQEARPFIESLPKLYPWIRLASHDIHDNVANRNKFLRMSQLIGAEPTSVPTFMWCGTQSTGYHSAKTTGNQLLQDLASCYRQRFDMEPSGLELSADSPPESHIQFPLIGSVNPENYSLPVLTLMLAGMDAFNPCAFFILMFLLSLLVNARSRKVMILVGGVFVFFSGLIYFLFMAAWLNVFHWLGEIRLITWVAGCIAVIMAFINIKDYFQMRKGVSLSLSDDQKLDIFRRTRGLLQQDSLAPLLTGTVILAVAANSYELLCTAGFPMVYTRILTLHELPLSSYYLYLVLYNLIYIVPLFLIVLLFVITMGKRKLRESEGRLLKLLSGLMMLGLGVILLLKPELLNQIMIAVLLVAGALGLTGLIAWSDRSGKETP